MSSVDTLRQSVSVAHYYFSGHLTEFTGSEDFLPGIVNQLGTFSPPKTSAMVANTREGPENLANLQRMAEQYQSNQA